MDGMSAYVRAPTQTVPVYTTETVTLMKPKSPLAMYLPLYIYVIIVIITLLINLFSPGSASSKIVNMLVSLVWYILWGLVIYFLCKSGNTVVAWIVLFISPIIWSVLAVLVFLGIIKR